MSLLTVQLLGSSQYSVVLKQSVVIFKDLFLNKMVLLMNVIFFHILFVVFLSVWIVLSAETHCQLAAVVSIGGDKQNYYYLLIGLINAR